MNPNEGRQSAHVTSRIVDKSNIVAPTEYLPLFTCLAPKGDSIEPVLIRNENSLIEEFGDPSINPDFYRDLVLIRDFVRAGKSCWVNRVAVEAKRFHYVYYLNSRRSSSSGRRSYRTAPFPDGRSRGRNHGRSHQTDPSYFHRKQQAGKYSYKTLHSFDPVPFLNAVPGKLFLWSLATALSFLC